MEPARLIMLHPPRVLKLLKWSVGVFLSLHLLLLLLLLGQYPALIRLAVLVLSQTSTQEGMRLAVYPRPQPSGRGRRQFVPGAWASIALPHASLEAYGIWDVRSSGTHVLVFRCDNHGAVFVDGHRVLGVRSNSANNSGRAAVSLQAGRHLLVVSLAGGPEQGAFDLEWQGPGQPAPAPLPAADLRPARPRFLPYFWRATRWAMAWMWRPIFWGSFAALALLAAASWQAATLKQVALHGLLIVAGLLVGAVIGEIGSRFVLPAPERVTYKKTFDKPEEDEHRQQFMIPTERGFRHNPNTEVVVRHPATPETPTLYRTNSIGYRNREIGPKQGERILFLGDSITLGLALNEPDTFVRRVEMIARAEGAGWETINAAVDGLGTNGELAVLYETGLALAPDVVVLDFYLNDFLESPGIYLTRLPGLIDRSWLAHGVANLLSRYLVLAPSEREALDSPPMLKPPDEIFAWQDEFRTESTVMPANQPADKPTRKFQDEVVRHFEDWGGAFSPHVWGKLEGLLAEFARLARERGFRFVIVAFPVRHQVESPHVFDYPQRRLKEISRRLEVPLLDLLPLLRAEYESSRRAGRPLFFDQCHVTPYGSELVARMIYTFLKRVPETHPRPGGAPSSSGPRPTPG